MSQAQLWLIIYGLFLGVGAFMGHRAGSKISLIMGLVSGALVFLGAYLITRKPIVGYGLLVVVNGLLVFVFAQRFLLTKKIMPTGMMLAVTTVVAVFCITQLIKLSK